VTARRREAGLVALIIGVCAAGIVAATRSSYFSADDWLNLAHAREYGMSWDYLKLGYFGHFAPVHRVLDWIWSVKLPGDWNAYLAVMVALHATAVAATYVLLRALRCSVLVAAIATTLFASSVVWVRIIQWPASAEHVAWALAATAVSLAAAVLWFQRRSPWLLALATGAMAAGLLSYEKPVLIVGYVVLLRYFVLAPSLRPRALLAQARADWPLLAALFGVAALYAVVVFAGDYSNTAERPSAGQLLEFLGRSWVRGTASLVVGQGSPEYADPIPLGLVILAQALLAAALVVSILRRRSAWRAWAFLLVCWLINVGLVGVSRIVAFGTGVGLDPRYNAEMALLLPLALALAFAPAGDNPAPAASHTTPRRPLATALGVGVAAALLAASCASAYDRVERSWQGGKARTWVDRVRATAPALRGPNGRVSVVDAAAPPEVVGINLPPFNLLSTVLPVVLDGRVDLDGGGERPAFVEPDGTLRPAWLTRLWGGPLASPQCGPATLTRTVDNGGEERPGLVRVAIRPPARPAHIDVLADVGAGFTVLPRAIRLPAGADAGGVAAEMKGLRTLELRVPAGVCVRSVTTALAG
jgi:hypothetical protein